MSDSIEKKHSSYFSNITAAIGQTISGWRKISNLKAEIKHCHSMIDLLKFSIEYYKEEMGASAYDLWTKGLLYENSLNEDLQKIKGKEENIARQNARIALLTEQIKLLRENRWVEIQMTEQKKPEEQKPEEHAAQIIIEDSSLPVVCPVCGARYKMSVNFCRKCGVRLLEETEREEKT